MTKYYKRKCFNKCFAILLAITFVLFFVACQRHVHAVDYSGFTFRNGDLVFRCGHGLESRAVKNRSRSVYSHVGILRYDSLAESWMVLHAVPGEHAEGQPAYLKADLLKDFFDPERAEAGAWLRLTCSDSIASKAAEYCMNKVKDSVLFDNAYLLKDSVRLYCCELVWRAYLSVGIDISGGVRHDVPKMFCPEGECIFPVDIQNSEYTSFVQPFKCYEL